MPSAQVRDALRIYRAALKAADPEHAIRKHLRFENGVMVVGRKRFRISEWQRIYVIGAGKASAAMAKAVEGVLGRRITGGLVNVPDGDWPKLRSVELHPCSHPLPDKRGEQGARRMLAMAEAAGENDLLICLISGGASALLPAPAFGMTLAGKRKITEVLLRGGASIHEVNVVRKHISAIKGGQLAAAAFPATILTMILSDVVGDDPAVIGSGPTVADPSTRRDAMRILRKYGIPPGGAGLQETPKPGDPRLARSHFEIVGSNREAIRAAAAQAQALSYRTLVLSATVEGEAREVAREHAVIARRILTQGKPIRPPACLLAGGETTVTVLGKGKGGRNQEYALAAALALEKAGLVTILSAGTDGVDGPTDAAGAVADSETAARAAALGLDARAYLANNDTYRFFERMNSLIKTGPTGTNVMDIHLLLIA
ncbi:MAG TPA: glycerate kinase [Bryobacteraceae bacterium]|nr:glycerate kinase [Bryobacteraceae bacterium]